MLSEKIKVWLHNIYMRAYWAVREPACCAGFKNPDGRLVDCSEWWGYQDCMFPGCGHYQIEHSDGTPNKIIYSKDNPELVGTEITDPIGCLNAGCDGCPKFWTKEDLHNYVQLLSRARNHATHKLFYDLGSERDENVLHVDAKVQTTVQVTVTVAHDSESLRPIFEREQRLMEEFPDVLFSFDVVLERQPSTDVKASISE